MAAHNRFSVAESTSTELHIYTDTIFAKEKYIVGNTCAQIFTDGEFVQIIPMRSKSDAGTTLDRINRDVGVANGKYMEMKPIRLVITQKCREWQDWQERKSEPLSHTLHGKKKLKVLLR